MCRHGIHRQFGSLRAERLCCCDLVKLKVRDIAHGTQVLSRAMIMQQKTHQPVQFEITEQTRDAVSNWIKDANLNSNDYLFKSRYKDSPHISTRQYARIVDRWVSSIGLDPVNYASHSIRRIKVSLIYR